MLIVTILTGALAGQPLSANRILDASNSEFMARATPREPIGLGTVSVQELRHPPEGRGLRLLLKAQESFKRGDAARAMEQLQAAAREPSAEPYALGMMAAQHIQRGDLDTALLELETSLVLLPGIAANHSNLALVLGARRRNEEALQHAKRALQLDPASAKTRFVLGQILLQMGQLDDARFHLERAAPDLPGARTLLARYFSRVEQ